MTTKVLKYEVEVTKGRTWALISQHTEKSAALAVAKRQSETAKIRIVEHTYDIETKGFDTRLCDPSDYANTLAPAPLPQRQKDSHKSGQGQSMSRILITTIVLAGGILGFLFGLSHLLKLEF